MTTRRSSCCPSPPVDRLGLYSRRTVAKAFGVAIRTIRRWETQRGLPSFKLGLNRVIPLDKLWEWCGQHEESHAAELRNALREVPREDRIA